MRTSLILLPSQLQAIFDFHGFADKVRVEIVKRGPHGGDSVVLWKNQHPKVGSKSIAVARRETIYGLHDIAQKRTYASKATHP